MIYVFGFVSFALINIISRFADTNAMLNIQYSTSPLLFSSSDHEPLISDPQAPQRYLFRLVLNASREWNFFIIVKCAF